MWDELKTGWVCLDCELMPWSSKAQELLVRQYAPTGASGRAALRETVVALRTAAQRVSELEPFVELYQKRAEMVGNYVDAYRRYCWPVHSLLDLKLAPFHLLATEGRVHSDEDHVWHMDVLDRLCQQDRELLLATPYKVIDLSDPSSEQEGVAWWEELTGSGGEGMVVKPLDFIARNKHLVQPAVKCRGREYLRIIYGPEYTAPEHLERLRFSRFRQKASACRKGVCAGYRIPAALCRSRTLATVHLCRFGVLALGGPKLKRRLAPPISVTYSRNHPSSPSLSASHDPCHVL